MEYILNIAIFVCLYGIIALSLNLLVGETGLVCVAQAALSGIGAYGTALFMKNAGMDFFLATALSMAIAAFVAALIGLIFARLRDVYYVFGTVGLNVILYSIFLNWQSLTGGPLGVANIPRPAIFGFIFSDNVAYLGLCVAALAGVYGVCTWIECSSFGRVLRAIREDERAVAAFSYRTTRYKVVVFAIASALAALSGALFAAYIRYIDPTSFIITESIFMLSIVILGGLGSSRGALFGAVILTVLPELLRFVGFPTEIAAQMRQLVYGLVLIFLMLYRPQGMLGTFRI